MRGLAVPMGAILLLTACGRVSAGSLVDVTVEVSGATAPLYPAPDGSGRLYFEARQGHTYALRIANRSSERLGTLVVVDGLNAIDGEREEIGNGRRGRLYVLGPWEDVVVSGWRSSLEEVRRFTFVDERASYSARSGKANRKMGWVEVAVYRERYPVAWRRQAPMTEPDARERSRDSASDRSESAPEAAAKSAGDGAREGVLGGVVGGAPSAPAPTGGYPGTGWGASSYDPATVVHFDAADHPAERITLRYEYASALRALGVYPPPWPSRDRLGERDRGTGFARPPRW